MDIVYIETSIVSHATARTTSDPATAVLQDQAKRWMDQQAVNYELVTSQIVLAEAGRGDIQTQQPDGWQCWPIFPYSMKTRMQMLSPMR